MAPIMQYLILVLLGSLQSGSCHLCQDYESTDSDTCLMLFRRFKESLLSSDLNLYNLRKTFSPVSRPDPILVNVSYALSFGRVQKTPCPGTEIGYQLFNYNSSVLNYGWTSTPLYSYFHPAQLNRMQPQLFFQFIKYLESLTVTLHYGTPKEVSTALTWNGKGPIATAKLSLHIPQLNCSPAYKDVYNTLWDITALVSVVAKSMTHFFSFLLAASYNYNSIIILL